MQIDGNPTTARQNFTYLLIRAERERERDANLPVTGLADSGLSRVDGYRPVALSDGGTVLE